MKRTVKMIALLLALLMLLCACGSEKAANAPTSAAAFAPKLDTQKTVELECAVSFGNFEAFDQVINHFNEIYPNVKVSYYQSFSHVPDFIENNPNVDIFMTTTEKGYPEEACADLTAAGVDMSAIVPGLLKSTTVDGKVLSFPWGCSSKVWWSTRPCWKKRG